MTQDFPTDAELHKAALELMDRRTCAYDVAIRTLVDLAKLTKKLAQSAYALLEQDGELDRLLNLIWATRGGNYMTAIDTAMALAASKGISVLAAAEAMLKDSALYARAEAFSREHGVSIELAMKTLASMDSLGKK